MSNYQIYRTLSGINKPQKSPNKISLQREYINTQRCIRKAGIVFVTTTSLISFGIIYANHKLAKIN